MCLCAFQFFLLFIIIFKYILLIMLLQLSQFFLPFIPPPPCTPHPPASPRPSFMSMGCTCKFFGFSVCYTILNLPLSILCLQIMLLIPCIFLPIFPLPTDNPPCDLHFSDCVPIPVVCLVCFCFCVKFSSW